MRATQKLPEGYQPVGEFDLSRNRGLAMILNLAGLGVLFGVGALFMRSLVWLRPAYLSSENILVITGMREFWRGILLLVVSVGLVITLREAVRGFVLWAVIGELPRLGARGSLKYASAPTWYLPRQAYLWMGFIPLVATTLLGIVAVTLAPLNFVPGVMLVVSMSAAFAVEDVVIAVWLLRKPTESLILNRGDCVTVYYPIRSPDA